MNQSKRKFLAALLAGLMLAGVTAQGAVFADETGVGTTVTTTADETTLTTDPADPATGGENDQEEAGQNTQQGNQEAALLTPANAVETTGGEAGTTGESVATLGITDEAVLREALEQAGELEEGNKTVTLTQNVEISSTITIPKGVTLDGAGEFTISTTETPWSTANGEKYMVVASSDATVQNLTIDAGKNASGCLQFYKATDGNIQNVTLKGAKQLGLNVNASTVTASGKLELSGNGTEEKWTDVADSINVSWGSNISGVKSCSFDASGATLDGVKSIYTDQGDADRAKAEGVTIEITPPSSSDYVAISDPETYLQSVNYMQKDLVPVFVDSEGYFSLQEAIDEAGVGATIKLNQNVKGNFTISEDENIILDLNGCTLDGKTTPRKAALTNYGTVTIQDSVGSGTIKRSDTGGNAYYTIQNEGIMTIKSGTVYNNSGEEPPAWSGSSLICNAASKDTTRAVLNIEGGIFSQENFIAIKNDEYGGVLNISGGIIKSNTQAVQNWGTANITGGDLTGAVTTWTYFSTNATTNITGGTIVGDIQATKLIYDNTPVTNRPTVKISGNANIQGEFKVGTQDDNDNKFAPNNDDANFTITGGTFAGVDKEILKEFLDDDCKLVKKDGKWVVKEKTENPDKPSKPSKPSTSWYPRPEKNGWEEKWNGDVVFYDDGEIVTGWIKDGGKWYYTDEETGVLNTEDWLQIKGTWYHFDDEGVMTTGWLKSGNTWYYLKSWGGMATGWQQVGGKWYYFKNWGGMATGWMQINGTWYYLQPSGAMATGWQQIGGIWYYFQPWGGMATGWQQVGGTWYYLKDWGAMVTGWQQIGDKQYYFDASGAWVK